MSNTRRIVLIVFSAIVVFSGFLIARFPANHALALAAKISEGMLTANNVSGTLWQGKADNIYVSYFNQSMDLGRTQWQLSFWPLLLGNVKVELQADAGKQRIKTQLLASMSSLQLKDTEVNMDVARLMQFYPLPIDVQGRVELLLQTAKLNQQGVEQIDGSIVLKDLAFTFQKSIELGSYAARLSMDGEDVKADISDLDANLTLEGYAKGNISQRRYEADINIKATEKTDDWIIQSLPMLAKKQADGSFLLQQSGNF